LMKAFEKALLRYSDRVNQPVHTIVQYNYTMEESRQQMMNLAAQERTLSFERIFDRCENRVHAIFTFLSLLELVQMKHMRILIGEGRNNFLIEYVDPADRESVSEADNSPTF